MWEHLFKIKCLNPFSSAKDAKHLEVSFVSEGTSKIYKEILFVKIIVKGVIS